jgi:hypothetical protein
MLDSDVARFRFCGYVKSQNSRMWSNEHPHVFQETVPASKNSLGYGALSPEVRWDPFLFEDRVDGNIYRDIMTQIT